MNGPFRLGELGAPLSGTDRRSLRTTLSALVGWQRRLGRFPRLGPAPDATPVVSLYADGELRGCSACNEGNPGERVARAFLLSLADLRFGGIAGTARANVVGRVAFPVGVRRVSLDAAPRLIAPGAHGVGVAIGDGFPFLLVPEVAREHELDAEGLLRALEHKAGVSSDQWPHGGLFVFETDGVVTRRGRIQERPTDPVVAGVRWLAERVASNGRVSFGLDPRAEHDEPAGPMLLGRAAVVVRALAVHPAGRSAATRAQRWLSKQIEKGLSGERIDGFPNETPLVAGTLALAKLAGLDVEAPLRKLARHDALRAAPWHAAQVACALGVDAPAPLWRACVHSLDAEPRAPWIAVAAAGRGDWPVFERVASTLAAHVREHGPHRGGVGSGSIPELALTAVTAEALAAARTEPTRRARRLALAFLAKHQFLSDVLPEARDPSRIRGAFPLTPIHSFLRADVTAHAVLALSDGDYSGAHLN